jgi:hypothetical protein
VEDAKKTAMPGPIPPPKLRKPRVIFNPAAYRGFQRGVNLVADAVRPTLGPMPRKGDHRAAH